MARRIVTAEEQDIHTGWRKVLCYTQRAGVTAAAKRRTNKRERREGRAEVYREAADYLEATWRADGILEPDVESLDSFVLRERAREIEQEGR